MEPKIGMTVTRHNRTGQTKGKITEIRTKNFTYVDKNGTNHRGNIACFKHTRVKSGWDKKKFGAWYEVTDWSILNKRDD